MSLAFVFSFLFNLINPSPPDIIIENLHEVGFQNISSFELNHDLYLTYENNLYRFEPYALANVLFILSTRLDSSYESINILLRNEDLPIVHLRFDYSELKLFLSNSNSLEQFISSISFSFDVDTLEQLFKDKTRFYSSYFNLDVPVGIDFDYLLGDYYNPIQTRSNFTFRPFLLLGKGSSLNFQWDQPIYNGIISNDFYPGIKALYLNQSYRFENSQFFNFSVGYFSNKSFGIISNYRKYLLNEVLYMEMLFGITRGAFFDEDFRVNSNRDTNSSWQMAVNYRWNQYDTDFSIRYGTFLSGDLGYDISVTKQYHETFIKLFYTRTDLISAGSFNSAEKAILGFALQLPLATKRYSRLKGVRFRSNDSFDFLYRYSGLSYSGIDLGYSNSIVSQIRQFYPEVLSKGLIKYMPKFFR